MGLIYDFDLLKYKNNIYHEIKNIVKDKNIILRCRNIAKKKLSLKKSIQLYKKIYYDCLV